jgi:hypothetical protein
MKVYFATWLFDKTLGWSMTKKRGNRRLLSYHFLREQGIDSSQLHTYCKRGKLNKKKNESK